VDEGFGKLADGHGRLGLTNNRSLDCGLAKRGGQISVGQAYERAWARSSVRPSRAVDGSEQHEQEAADGSAYYSFPHPETSRLPYRFSICLVFHGRQIICK